MKKTLCVIACSVLLVWFFLDMTGLSLGNQILVSQAWKDDGIFFLIYLAVFVLFLVKESLGKYALLSWLIVWFSAQFYSHWYFTMAGPWDGKINYFSGTIKLFPSSTVYIADLYHIILHILILFALICALLYCIKSMKRKKA